MIAAEVKNINPNNELIKDVPSHWNVVRLKTIVKGGTNGVWGSELKINKNDIVCVRVADIDEWQYGINKNNLTYRNIAESDQNGRLLNYGDLIIEKSGGGDISPVGRVVIFNLTEKAVTSNFMARLDIVGNINKEFLYYYFRFLYNRRLNFPAVKATTGIQNLDLYAYLQNQIAIPTPKEQEYIIEFINQTSEKITHFIQTKKRFIELLKEQRQSIITNAVTKGIDEVVKMKETGIDWMPQIPEHWEVRKISRIFSGISSGTTPESSNMTYYENGHINWINTGDLNDGILIECKYKVTKKALKEYPTLKVYPTGTILVAMYGATIGKVSLLEIEGCTNQACCALYDSDIYFNEFSLYSILASKEAIINESYGGGQPNISQDVIRRFKLPIPEKQEQKRIVEYIKKETRILDIAIGKAEREIELIKEYREAMIAEAVTGKLKL